MATGSISDALSFVEVTVLNTTSLSAGVDLGRLTTLVGIQMPTGWDAASITFQASTDNGNWFNLFDSTAEISLTGAAASRYLALTPATFAGIRYLKVRSGTSGAAVNQTADRVVRLVVRHLGPQV